MNRVWRTLAHAPILLYRGHLGWLLGSRFLVLHHIGRRSGRPYSTALEVVLRDGPTNSYYVAAGFGSQSDWHRNVLTEPHVRIELGSWRMPALAEPLTFQEACDVLATYARDHKVAFFMLGLLFGLRGQRCGELARRLPIVRLRTTQPTRPVEVRSAPALKTPSAPLVVAGPARRGCVRLED